MSSTTTPAYHLFHMKRVMPMAAARFGAFRNLFGHIHHHSRRHNNHGALGRERMAAATSNHNHHLMLESPLRHASAMSSAILRNLSSSTAMGEPSQLVDPSSSDFDERHRHYSFITVLAITSLFVLITISIVALILGFCRKNSSVFSLGGSGTGSGGSNGGSKDRKGRGFRADGNKHDVSQFELDSLDADLADGDMETKSSKDDPAGVCYYHLNDNDDDDDDDADDDIYDSDEDYFEIDETNNYNDANDNNENNFFSRRKKKKQRGKRKLQKAKLRFRDSRYYYHLHNDDEDDDDSGGDYSFHQQIVKGEDNDSSRALILPKRSTTFPQLHNVLTSCIKGDSISSYQEPKRGCLKASKLSPSRSSSLSSTSPPLSSTALPSPSSETPHIIKNSLAGTTTICCDHTISSATSPAPTSFDNENPTVITQINSQNRQNKSMTDTQVVFSNETSKRKARTGGPFPRKNTISKLNAKKLTVSTVPHHHSRQTAFIPAKRRRRLFKSYSLHDIPHKGTNRIPKSWCPPAWHPNILGVPCRQGASSHQVTFKVGTTLGDTDIRLHHV